MNTAELTGLTEWEVVTIMILLTVAMMTLTYKYHIFNSDVTFIYYHNSTNMDALIHVSYSREEGDLLATNYNRNNPEGESHTAQTHS